MPEDVPQPPDSQIASSPQTLEGNGQSVPSIAPSHPLPAPASQLFYEVRLPDKIPDAWLNDLKNALKESRTKLILTTVLSSSLLTGVLSAVGNYYLDRRKEVRVAALDLKKEQAREKLRQYDALSANLSDFKQTFRLSLIVFNAAKTKMEDESISVNVANSVQSLLDQLGAVAEARGKIDDSELTDLVNKTFQQLTPALAKAHNDERHLHDLKAINNLISICDSASNQGVRDINELIERKRQAIYADLEK